MARKDSDKESKEFSFYCSINPNFWQYIALFYQLHLLLCYLFTFPCTSWDVTLTHFTNQDKLHMSKP